MTRWEQYAAALERGAVVCVTARRFQHVGCLRGVRLSADGTIRLTFTDGTILAVPARQGTR